MSNYPHKQPYYGSSETIPWVSSILVLLFCCQPLGIVSVVFCAIAAGAQGNDPAKFSTYCGYARTSNIFALMSGLLVGLLWVVLAAA